MIRLRFILILAALAAALQGCARAPDRRAADTMSGTGGSFVTIGTVTRLGSVVVSGFEWSTGAAQILINGKRGVAEDLRMGMVVRVEGTRTDPGATRGAAKTLRYEADLIGPLDRSTRDSGGSATGMTTLKITGQQVFADSTTRFDGFRELAELVHNDVLEVSGYRDRAGLLHATWIGRLGGIEALGRPVRVKGFASKPTATQFRIGELTVLSPIKAREGDFVAVTGTWRVAAPELAASAVQSLRTAVSLRENVPVIMEGLIRFVSASGFTLHDRPIVISATTAFGRGSAQDLREDRKVQVLGVFKDGVLAAQRIVLAETR